MRWWDWVAAGVIGVSIGLVCGLAWQVALPARDDPATWHRPRATVNNPSFYGGWLIDWVEHEPCNTAILLCPGKKYCRPYVVHLVLCEEEPVSRSVKSGEAVLFASCGDPTNPFDGGGFHLVEHQGDRYRNDDLAFWSRVIHPDAEPQEIEP